MARVSPRKGKGKKRQGDGSSGPVEMQATGQSADWISGTQNHLRIGDDFLEWIAEEDAELSLRFGRKWVEVSEEEARKTDIYGHLATFLAEKYVIGEGNRNHGKKMAVGTVHGVWRGGWLMSVGSNSNCRPTSRRR